MNLRNFHPSKNFFYRFLFLMIFLSYVGAVGTYAFENYQGNQDFSVLDMLFWWASSMTTVGIGAEPVTDGGKIMGIITMLAGATVYLAVISEVVVWIKNKSDERYRGYGSYNGSGHVLIIGYNELALGLLNLLDKVLKPDVDIVLLTNQIESNPNIDRIYFVRKSPANSKVLSKVNVGSAKVAFVLSRDEVSDKKADLNTLLIASMIEDTQNSVFTFAEVSDKKLSKDLNILSVDETFTFEELLKDIRNDHNHSDILKKLPKEIREGIVDIK